MVDIKIRNFKEIPYDELEELNLQAKEDVRNLVADDELKEQYLRYLHDERQLKAVTVCFSDLEGRFHMLDYDKKYLARSFENLTFDGSSIRGFSAQAESDLRLSVDWGSFRWLPSDVFGPGKVMVFALIMDRDGTPYCGDTRGRLRDYARTLRQRDGITANLAFEVEGFLFKGSDAEQDFDPRVGFDFVSEGGYFHALPTAPLKVFIDRFAEAQRALGFENEKDHPEVAPSQFELNYRYVDALIAADQVQLYKLLARQIAASMGYTASFLPKPRTGINGSGMHTNISLTREGKNLLFDPKGDEQLSPLAWSMVDNILHHAEELCLILNASVNAYRRLDPHFEAPNQIRASAVDRTAMVRIPLGDENAARIEVRSVGPDANPYLLIHTLLHTALLPNDRVDPGLRKSADRVLPACIYDALDAFEKSQLLRELLGEREHQKYAALKRSAANRSPRELGSRIKAGEVIFHHEVTNQYLWGRF